MRRLFLLRHADASPAAPGMEDRKRPLSVQGRREADVLGQRLKAMRLFPQYVICSPARRTRETYDVLENYLPETACIYPEFVYNASPDALMKAVHQFTDSYGSVLLIGHNPGIHDLARALARKGDHEDLNNLARAYRPCTLSVIEAACQSWALVEPALCRLAQLIAP